MVTPISNQPWECSICLHAQGDEPVRVLEVCKHIFHEACIKGWEAGSNACPICREAINPSLVAAIPTQNINQTPLAEPEDSVDNVIICIMLIMAAGFIAFIYVYRNELNPF